MTYKELLQTLADRASANYKNYLQAKIDTLVHPSDQVLPDKIQQFRDASEYYEKKFTAVMAMVKNDEGLDQAAPEEEINNALK
ncbi:hypothetical protein [Pedobacter nutrimenti]|jgi:hypothetical protein|uniref:Uncharacterized protein n=1 Tax=Pedobacter nutrimenti TaxID=1241337 RepID=A0A318UAS1_9SPHI|nr:hypothetical protein [Pedobacter nutrimenti]PYF70039.1 hypothetical protein B0O44_109130 [Pedobacter nutrimenti]